MGPYLRLAGHLGRSSGSAVELRPIVQYADDIRSRFGLHGGRNARLGIVRVARLDVQPDAGIALAFWRDLPPEVASNWGQWIQWIISSPPHPYTTR